MKAIIKFIGVLVIVLLGIQAASATVTVRNIQVNPAGDLLSGKTSVDAKFVVYSPATGGGTKPTEDILFFTDLQDPKWTYSLSKGGIKQDTGKTAIAPNFKFSAYELYYTKEDVSIDVSLSGIAPEVTSVTNTTVFRVGPESSPSAIASVQRTVINPASTTQGISAVKTTLADFRSLIDQKSAVGVNTNEANAKYDEASNAIRTAEQAPNYAVSQQNLQKAQDLVNEGKTLLDKASSQKLISDAQAPIDQTDQLITFFTVNKSMKENDPKLVLILTKRELAKGLVTDAKDLVTQGRYSDANNKANEASTEANEALKDALALKKEIGDSGNLFGGVGAVFGSMAGVAMYIVIVIIAVVIVVAGVIVYKRRNRWDELG